jgi:aryl sulfotransferase
MTGQALPRRTRSYLNHVTDSRRWDRFVPRAGDILISTAPKCGTTWTQRIVSLLVFQSVELPVPLVRISPWVDASFLALVVDCFPVIEEQAHRRFLKSHLPLDALPYYPELKYITVARDGRDAFMSLWNHVRIFTPAAYELLDRAAPSGQGPYERASDDIHEFWRTWIQGENAPDSQPEIHLRMFDVVRSFWDFRRVENILHVHYNDLKRDLDGEMRRIAAFLEIPVREESWGELVSAATFASMKRDGPKLLEGIELVFEGGSRSFLHRGTNDRWRDVLGPGELADYDALVRRTCTPELARWLEHGREGCDPRAI